MVGRTEKHVIVAALISRAAQIEVDLSPGAGEKPSALQLVLTKARNEAIEACAELIVADPTNAKLIQKLQGYVQQFLDLVEFSRITMQEAEEAETDLSLEEREIVGGLVLGKDVEDVAPQDDQES